MLPTSPKMKNREYRTASGRRSVVSSNEHTVWFGGEVVAKKDDIETGRDKVETVRE